MCTATVEEYRRVTDVNILGVYNCYAHAARRMIEQGQGGHIIGAWSVIPRLHPSAIELTFPWFSSSIAGLTGESISFGY